MNGGRLSSCGFFVGPTPSISAPRTYVVIGVPRGGTSMCSGALRLVGIPMGDDVTANSNEDRDFLLHKGDVALFNNPQAKSEYLARVQEVVAERNQRYPVWGWKDPISVLYLDDIIKCIRNPHLILIKRDPAAVSIREWNQLPQSHLKSVSSNFYLDQMERTLLLYSRAVRIVRETGAPTLVLSYERSLRYREDFARHILAFTGMNAVNDELQASMIAKIAAYVKPDAVSGRLPGVRREENLKTLIRTDLSFYGSIEEAYSACANLVNAGEYTKALALSSSILMVGIDGGRVAPQFVVPPQRFAAIEAGLSFIRAVAFTNLADHPRALQETLKFSAAQSFLQKYGISDPMVQNLQDPLSSLRDTLEKLIFQEEAVCPLPN